MPTGYTSDINDGKEVSRNEFILRCARAFGALMMMRDAPLDAPIPERFEPSTHAKESLEKAKQLLTFYESISYADAQAELEREHKEAVERYDQMVKRENELKERYQHLLGEVETWNPPTEEHAQLKRFCMKQLTDSMEHDCNSSAHMQNPVKFSVEKWRTDKIAYALREIDYYKKEWEAEVARTDNRNMWLKQLRESL